MSVDEAREALEDLDRILAKSGDPHRRNVQELLGALGNSVQAFSERYCTVVWWGGAGSMSDLWPGNRWDTSMYQKLLVKLVDAAESIGAHCDAAVERAGRLRDFHG